MKPQIVADSAFGSLDLMKEVTKWGGHGTFSVSANSMTWIWNILGKNVPATCWRAAINEDNVIASSTRIVDSKGAFVQKNIISNAYAATKVVFDSTGIVPLDRPEGIYMLILFEILKVECLASPRKHWSI